MDPKSNFQPIPSQILRKYIMYTKSNIEPVIGKEAANVLREFYVKLRQTNTRANGCNPITMRQLESLIRLTQARAKCEMRKVCTENDAKEVVEIMKTSMIDYLNDGSGDLDTSRSLNSSMDSSINKSKIKNVKDFEKFLQRTSEERGTREFSLDELKKIIQVRNSRNFLALFVLNIFIFK